MNQTAEISIRPAGDQTIVKWAMIGRNVFVGRFMKVTHTICSFLVIAILCTTATGCASIPKPKTVGQTVGLAIDGAMAWTSKSVRTFLKK